MEAPTSLSGTYWIVEKCDFMNSMVSIATLFSVTSGRTWMEGRYHGILRWSFELTAVEIFRILHELFILSWEKWCFIMIYHDLSWFIMIYDDLWWFMMIYDDLWWFMMIYAHKSGSGINQYSLLVSPLIPSQHLVILGSRSAAGPDHSAIAQGFLKAPFSGVGVQQQHRSSPKAVHTQKYHQKRESLKCCQPKWNYQNYQNNKHITNENLPLIWSTFSNALCSDPVLLNGK